MVFLGRLLLHASGLRFESLREVFLQGGNLLDDQVTDAKYLADEWKVGIRMSRGQTQSKVIGRKEVEMCLREATSGVMAPDMKMNALKWKKLAEEAVDGGGFSFKVGICGVLPHRCVDSRLAGT
ncbi:hypothetical protein Tco_1268100 [Tanacetum coccineum]